MSLVNPNRGCQHKATTCAVWGWTWRKGRSQLHDRDGWGDTIWLVWYRERLGSGLNGSLGPSMQQELERNPGVQLESATQRVLVHWCIKNMQVEKKTYVTYTDIKVAYLNEMETPQWIQRETLMVEGHHRQKKPCAWTIDPPCWVLAQTSVPSEKP